jgi:hypothetical protein
MDFTPMHEALEPASWARAARLIGAYLAIKRAEYRQGMAAVGERDWRWYLTQA